MLLEMITEDDNNQDNLCLLMEVILEPDHITLCCYINLIILIF